eukprot:Hpha_TRINITY_DN13218_c0_g2::TRINITY_DN13218_c0_g2_i2::g.154952::m.154952
MALRTGSPRQLGADGVTREGMDNWDRSKDNRLRELNMMLERGDHLTEEEQAERKRLDETNQKFLAAGVAFQRGEKLGSMDTIIVLMGYSVGIGNLWRFSHLSAKHGGLAFVVAYILCLVFVAQPVYLLELLLGQDTRAGLVHCHRKVARRWAGIGYGFVAATVIVQGYYSMFLAYSLVYMGNSLYSPLPWSDAAYWDAENNRSTVPVNMTAAEFFWNHDVLGDDGSPTIMWRLVVALIISYILIFLAVWRGIATTSRIAYWTVTVPCVLLFALVIWADACSQTLFSLIFLPGTTVTLASFMQEKEDVYRIHRFVAYANAAFSIFGGFAVFCVLGHTATKSCYKEGATQNHTCRTVEDIIDSSGGGLAFVALAEGIATIPEGNNVFALFFFLMCFLLGLDTCFTGVEVLVIFVRDNFTYFGKTARQEFVAGGLIITFFLFSLLYCGAWGFKLLESVDHVLTTYVMLIGQLLQCVMFRMDWTWERLAVKVQLSTIGTPGFPRGRELPERFRFLLYWFAPGAFIVFTFGFFIDDIVNPFGYRSGRSYSAGYIVIAWLLTLFVFALMPGGYYIEKWYEEKEQSRKTAAIAQPLLADGARELCEIVAEGAEDTHHGGVNTGESLLSVDELQRASASPASPLQPGSLSGVSDPPQGRESPSKSKKKQPNRVRRTSMEQSRPSPEASPLGAGRSPSNPSVERPRRNRPPVAEEGSPVAEEDNDVMRRVSSEIKEESVRDTIKEEVPGEKEGSVKEESLNKEESVNKEESMNKEESVNKEEEGKEKSVDEEEERKSVPDDQGPTEAKTSEDGEGGDKDGGGGTPAEAAALPEDNDAEV